ncbi:ABC transporter ATP-binding protein [Clostridium frigidicarnis]|uniref:ATP-binding cassette, subfamily B n=1 Tax=Clostridium frigidicarnis TaxID=84698 RepID=A0A1I0YI55_9CLOT|nr:ABC transporter ATP-binding protein [Clostridium frigidicarnis]SFB12436.1 ATP-binding cassette, subfamily B [Clostridium frigidicarnis]
MFKLVKYLKQFTISILVIIALLLVQATCDLSLPDYMSNIVNVGIQQEGVKNAVPDVIRKSELDKLSLFMNSDENQKVLDNYILLNKDTLNETEYNDYVKKYPELKNEPLYKLNTKNKKVNDELNTIMAKPILITLGIEKDGLQGMESNKDMNDGAPKQQGEITQGAEGMDPFVILSKMPEEKLKEMRTGIDEKFEEMPESMLTQSAVSYIHDEYGIIGIDTSKQQLNYILFTGLLMVGIALVSMAATVIVGLLSARIAAGLSKNLRKNVFEKVTNFSNVELNNFSTASLITRSTNDIQQIQMFTVMIFKIVFYAPILGVGGIIKVINTDVSMAWIIAVAVMAILTLVVVLFGMAIPRFKRIQKIIDKLNLVTRELLTGMLVIRAFSTEKHEEKKFDNVNKDLTKTNLFVNRIMSSMMPLMMLIMNCITILIVWVGSHQVDAGTMQVGNMMAFMQYTMQIIMSFLMLSMISIMLPRASVSAQRITEVLDTEATINDPTTDEEFNEDKNGYVEFKNVGFKYPGAEENVISDITFVAKPGETTAFIGSTGSGKSTLVNLVPRFYDSTEGEILVDGVNVKNVKQHELRDKIGYVPQKGILFSGTIDSNLKYGKKNATEEELLRASEIAQAMEFISSKSEGFDTEISQGGTNVSGGQKQRLSIARAIVKKPEIYIFDDSFSALDFKTDAALRKALKEKTAESTVLLVAQRISTIMHAEQIVVLDEGKMVGIGTHSELMEKCEVYKQIALSQLSKEELA